MQTRLRLLSVVFLLGFFLLIVRLFYWQVYRGKELSAKARGQYQHERTIDASRGNILAKDGSWLAARSDAWLVFADLSNIEEDRRRIADKLAPLFVEDPNDRSKLIEEVERLVELLSKDKVVWVPLKHKITSELKENIEAIDIAGIGFDLEEIRIYPEASSAAQLLGFVGKNEEGSDQGYFGLEGYYDLMLSGKPGFLSRESDAKGIPLLFGDARLISAIGGVNLITHFDKAVQLIVDENLKDGLEKYGAVAGNVTIIDPKTGGIMAMAAYPSYDPSKYSHFSDELFKNPVVSSSFEPGSIFKIIVMASALDSDTVEPDTKCEICDGPLRVDKYIIETWDQQYRPDSTMLDVIVHSDNVGMAYVAQEIGADKMYDYLESFGFGNLSGVDLQGEASPKLREKGTWNIVDLSTTGFGQGVASTPIQMIQAVTAIANNGDMATPQVVDKIIGDGWEEDIKPEYKKNIISEKSANEMTAMMVEAASKGEAKWTHLRGFKVAGKTGTAQIPIAGHYDEEKTIASFIGFAPADDPKFLMLVTLREPSSSPWASETAAPLWYSIAKDLFLYFGIQPEN